ncbi:MULTISPECIES: YdcF family protein [Rhodopseudomonas]|uniref:Membrane protein n=1 Tax=Rhodopseudomonas palustris TaxID=1076 RepID=A0A0D7E278_RHOPL|nr:MULTISPECIES: YdcF family protein [Rhodopseudomonas]KIZ34601.1 membrane protein [Rhodopseudomonas palustris]MDF3811575.1 YdcF family protein [Rhodopseudomonas sp. BAL398]WOK19383.1 YdcF family protein [Rhodopseudomonas sp. BAL398]
MFFIISKILGFFLHPSNAIAVICAAGAVLLLSRWRRAGIRTVVTGIVLLLLFGYSPLGRVLMLTLSERFPAWQSDGRAPDGIIVLGGSIDSDATAARHSLELDSSAERIVAMLELARRFPQARIVFSGGSGNLIEPSLAEAPIAGQELQRFGVAPDRIVLETRSRTTAENAGFTRQLVSPKPGERWLLITSAFHMPRAVGAFRAVGFAVEAYPVDWRSRGWIDATQPFDRLSSGLARTDVAIHEWAGLIAYWLSGRTSALLPGP